MCIKFRVLFLLYISCLFGAKMCPKSIVNVATGCAVCAAGQSECAGVAAASMDTATPPGFMFFSVMTELPVTYG